MISSRHTVIVFLKMSDVRDDWEAPHCVEVSPAGVACNPRDARVKEVIRRISSPTDDQPPPRQEGEAVVRPSMRQLGDGAGVGGREQLHT